MQENNKKIKKKIKNKKKIEWSSKKLKNKKNEKKYPISALIHPIGCFVTGH